MSFNSEPDSLVIPKPERMAMGVVERLTDAIVSGKFPTGTLLPTEPNLSATFGVSRTIIRESLRVLEEKGLISVRQGQGSTVLGEESWNFLDPAVLNAAVVHDASGALIYDAVALRVVVESQVAGEAAGRRDDDHVADLKAAIELMDVKSPSDFLRGDAQFHKGVMTASGNALASAVLRALLGQMGLSPRYHGRPTHAQLELSRRSHQAILDAIIDKDATRASAAMRDHIFESWLLRSGLSREEALAHRAFAPINWT